MGAGNAKKYELETLGYLCYYFGGEIYEIRNDRNVANNERIYNKRG
jgi:hypothetical protein